MGGVREEDDSYCSFGLRDFMRRDKQKCVCESERGRKVGLSHFVRPSLADGSTAGRDKQTDKARPDRADFPWIHSELPLSSVKAQKLKRVY